MFEHACHEGNRSMTNALTAARIDPVFFFFFECVCVCVCVCVCGQGDAVLPV